VFGEYKYLTEDGGVIEKYEEKNTTGSNADLLIQILMNQL